MLWLRYAEPDAKAAVKDAHILVFVLPHQFLPGLLNSIRDSVLPDAVGVSLVKGEEFRLMKCRFAVLRPISAGYLEINRDTGSITTGTQLIEAMLG